MPIILPHNLTSAEIRVLQEFRRLNVETLAMDTIKVLKHPAGGGEAPAAGLVSKGFLQTGDGPAAFTLTQKAKDFLAIDPVPLGEEPGSGSGDENPDADAV
jgi:hypothetical protein